jgi:hypothetical protein
MKYVKMQKPLETDGYRIAWFIPLEMIMSGLALHMGLQGNMFGAVFWMVVFIVPLAIWLDGYMPSDHYYSVPIPKEEDYPDQTTWVNAIETWYKNDPVIKTTVPGRPLPKLFVRRYNVLKKFSPERLEKLVLKV